MKQTQHETILKYLRENQDWVPSYALGKRELCGIWVGSRGERSARDLAEETEPQVLRKLGKELIYDGITKDFQNKEIVPKYAYYKAKSPLKTVVYKIEGTDQIVLQKKLYA